MLDRIGELLLADEARHNLAFGILATARAHPEVYPELVGWVVREGGDAVVGAALRTPPHNLVVAKPVSSGRDQGPGGRGRGRAARRGRRRAGGGRLRRRLADAARCRRPRRRSTSGSTRSRDVVPPPRDGRRDCGSRRRDDRELVIAWVRAFADEVLHGGDEDGSRLERSVDARLASGDAGVGLWEVEGRAVSLAGFGGPTPNGIRIGPVYTPPGAPRPRVRTAVTAEVVAGPARPRSPVLLPLHGSRQPDLERDLHADRLRAVCDSRELAFVPDAPAATGGR